jgi:hypothetical protein
MDQLEYEQKKQEVISSIKCKMVHENEMFIASDMTLWPCCFLFDSTVKNKDGINDKLAENGADWNNLRKHSVEEILNHNWFKKELSESWDPEHPKHLSRCIRTCAYNKAYQNEIFYKVQDK